MLDKKDLQSIKEVVTETVGESLQQIVLPRFDAIEGRLEKVESSMVTMDYLDRRLERFKDELKDTGSKALRKISRLTEALHANGGLTAAQVVEIGKA
jgi:hypothetical protein